MTKLDWNLSHDVMVKILRDISTNTPPADSKMDYDEEMLDFRKEAEADWLAFKKEHPDGVMDFSTELPE